VHKSKITRWCGTLHGKHVCDHPQITVVIHWTARVPVTNDDSRYTVKRSFTPSGRCPAIALAGGGYVIDHNVTAGQRLSQQMSFIACPGTAHISVVYSQNHGPATDLAPIANSPGQGPSILVGQTSLTVP
jgi:hypothetical protein